MENIKTQSREFALQFLFHLQLPIFEETRMQLIEADDDSKLQELWDALEAAVWSVCLRIKCLHHAVLGLRDEFSNNL